MVSILVVMGAAQGTLDPASLHASGWLLFISGKFANCYLGGWAKGCELRKSEG